MARYSLNEQTPAHGSHDLKALGWVRYLLQIQPTGRPLPALRSQTPWDFCIEGHHVSLNSYKRGKRKTKQKTPPNVGQCQALPVYWLTKCLMHGDGSIMVWRYYSADGRGKLVSIKWWIRNLITFQHNEPEAYKSNFMPVGSLSGSPKTITFYFFCIKISVLSGSHDPTLKITCVNDEEGMSCSKENEGIGPSYF